MANTKTWFVVINPTSGNGLANRKWPQIESLLRLNDFNFEYHFTKDEHHCQKLIQNAINQDFKNILSIGGDGTLHHVINGIMSQKKVDSNSINVGIIPVGTGNDWVKTHQIPNNIEDAIKLIKKGQTRPQDIGKIELLNQTYKSIYFMNLAGIGFDGYVVSKVGKYKHFGTVAYLLGAIMGLFAFKNFKSKVLLNSEVLESKMKMILIGLCTYSGGGMQLTKMANPFDGLFDISVVKNMNRLDLIINLTKLFNGKITNHKKVVTYKTQHIKIEIDDENVPFIQADGELIGKGNIEVSIIPKAFSFYC